MQQMFLWPSDQKLRSVFIKSESWIRKPEVFGALFCLLDDGFGKWLSYPDMAEVVSSKAPSDSNQ